MSKAKGKVPKPKMQKTPRYWTTRVPPPDIIGNHLNPRALSRVLGVSVRTIYSRRHKHRLMNHTVMHGTHYYHIDDVAAYASLTHEEIFSRLLK